jgi:N6-adenosine-specific RNA methylase IME4
MGARVVVADPPWAFGDKLPGPGRGAEKHYAVMREREVVDFLPALELREPGLVEPDARLLLWRVASMQEEALRVMRGWGFAPKAELVWLKRTATGKRWFGMGRQVRMEHEVCLIGVRGRPPPPRNRATRSTFEAAAGRHSAKPEAFAELVEALYDGPYLELFARRARPGWDCRGHELEAEQFGLVAP